jgi:putative DNA methylase
VLFAQLVDDPSAHPDKFPAEADQAKERRRLFDLIERLVVWENTTDEDLLKQAYNEIAKCFDGRPPAILDPFAGGGSIPLEAQRLGLEAHASDLNPVAVLINKALIEIPHKWAREPPVFPGAAETRLTWPRVTGLAEDVRRYGQWMRDEAEKRIGHLYPSVTLSSGKNAEVIAWIWARTVACPNPACGIEMPLVSSWWLSKKQNRLAWIQPEVVGRELTFGIESGKDGPPASPKHGRGAKFGCVACEAVATDTYVKSEAIAGRMGSRLLAVAAEGDRQRVYLRATQEHAEMANVSRPEDVPDSPMPTNPRWFSPPAFGMHSFSDLFTNRQLVALTTFSNLVLEARNKAAIDARKLGRTASYSDQYADAVALYLGFAVSRLADYGSTISTWMPDPKNEGIRNTFARQAIPMTWDYAEANPFSSSSGNWTFMLRGIGRVLDALLPRTAGVATQANAETAQVDGKAVGTDPPYYDNIGYADLSDFFYVWLRRSLGSLYSDATGTVLTPKVEELVATPYRFRGSKAAAEKHFERGFVKTFARICEGQRSDVPTTVFYAFKQAEDDGLGTASTGWETMLNGLTEAGLAVTATWPMRTERAGRSVGIGTNALASSVVLACRPRPDDAPTTTRRAFLGSLKEELPTALRELQQGSIAPVDLAQAAIGPGMAVYSRYAKVLEPDGTPMTVRAALSEINRALDEVLSEQEGDFDTDTRFCIKWFSQYGWDEALSGTADTLSRAVNTSVDGLVRGGIFWQRAGKARLIEAAELVADWDPATDERISVWEVVLRLAKALDETGAEDAARLMAAASQRIDLDAAKELAYLLFSICEKRKWTQTALLFNGLGTSWSDLSAASRAGGTLTPPPAQGEFDFSIGEG